MAAGAKSFLDTEVVVAVEGRPVQETLPAKTGAVQTVGVAV